MKYCFELKTKMQAALEERVFHNSKLYFYKLFSWKDFDKNKKGLNFKSFCQKIFRP